MPCLPLFVTVLPVIVLLYDAWILRRPGWPVRVARIYAPLTLLVVIAAGWHWTGDGPLPQAPAELEGLSVDALLRVGTADLPQGVDADGTRFGGRHVPVEADDLGELRTDPMDRTE